MVRSSYVVHTTPSSMVYKEAFLAMRQVELYEGKPPGEVQAPEELTPSPEPERKEIFANTETLDDFRQAKNNCPLMHGKRLLAARETLCAARK
eukprot:1155150-Pelagomonas_calceolata.AAC.22